MACPCDVSRFQRLETLTRFSPNYRSILSSFNFSWSFFPAFFIHFLSHFYHRCLLSSSNTFSFLLLSYSISSFSITSLNSFVSLLFHVPSANPSSHLAGSFHPSFRRYSFVTLVSTNPVCQVIFVCSVSSTHPIPTVLYTVSCPLSPFFCPYVALQPQDPLYPFHFAFPLSLSVYVSFVSCFSRHFSPL